MKSNYLSIKAAIFAILTFTSSAVFAQSIGTSASISTGGNGGNGNLPPVTAAPEPLSWTPVVIGALYLVYFAFRARSKDSKNNS